MPAFQQYILVIGAFQGLLLFVLLATDRRTSGASQLLGVACLCLALFLCVPFIIQAGPDGLFIWLVGWLFYLPASIGGLSYLYCRNSVLGVKFSLRQLLHLWPLLLCYLLTADYILFSPDKLARWIDGGNNSYSSSRLVISEYILFGQAFFYFTLTVRLVSRYKRRANDKLANFNPDTFRWLALFLSMSLCVWFLKALFAFIDNVPAVIYYGSDVMIVVLIYVIATAQWRHPQLFTLHKHGEEALTTSLAKEESNKPDGVLDPDTRAEMLALVKEKMESNELFRDSDLTLSRLADATGLNSHHLSEVLNQQAGKNFYQFINAYRVDYVCTRFKQDNESRVLDIAMDAGFSSKSTFNSIFKQFKGLTPTQYRKTALNQA